MSTLCASFLDIGPLAVLKSKRAIQSQTRNLRPSFHWPPKLPMFQDTAVELLKRSTQRIEVCVGNAGEWPRSWSSQARWWGSPQAPLKRIQDLGLKLLVLQLQQFFWDASRLKPWSESFLLLLNLDPFIEFEVGHFPNKKDHPECSWKSSQGFLTSSLLGLGNCKTANNLCTFCPIPWVNDQAVMLQRLIQTRHFEFCHRDLMFSADQCGVFLHYSGQVRNTQCFCLSSPKTS